MPLSQLDDRSRPAGPQINPARVVERIIRYWYLIVITLGLALTGAWLVNRYTTKIFPVTASIMIRTAEENIGARFLYNNALINPGRNYYNEFYIMRSYPLLQQVIEDLNFDVSYFVSGEIKSKEHYMPHFPVHIRPANGSSLPYGKSFRFKVVDSGSFILEPADKKQGPVYAFNDTIAVNGSRVFVQKTGDVDRWAGKEYELRFNNSYSLAKRYSSNLALKWAEQGSAVIHLSVRGEVPEKEKDFLYKFVEYYQRYDIDKKQVVASRSIEFLDRQVNLISDSLQYYESKIAYHELTRDYSRERSLQKVTGLGETIEAQEMQLRLQDSYFNYLEEYLRNETDYDQVILPSALGITDPIMSSLVAKLVDLQFQARLLKDQLAANNNPLVTDSKDKIGQYKRDIYEAIRSARDIMQVNRRHYNARMKELEANITNASEPDKEVSNMRRNYKLMESLYSFLIQKRAEAGISRASTTSDIIVVNPPEAGGPITPQPVKNYTYAIAIGLLLPLSLFILMEFFNTKVQSKEDIESISSVPVIGTIGHKTTDTNLAAMEKPRSYLAESFRALRSNLSYFTENREKVVVLITSSISGEGKTFTSINLSTVIAFTGKKVVLIGGDMRKAEITKDFEVSNRKGLSLYLSAQAEAAEIIQKTKIENLDFIPPGPTPPNPAELYLSARIGNLIAKLQESYDYVIIDSPPVGLVSDALPLIGQVDHVLFVTRQGYTPLSAINQLQFMVDQGQVQHVSIVLNDITRVGMGYGYKYGYAYDYGYGYRYGQGRYYGKKGKGEYGDDVYYS